MGNVRHRLCWDKHTVLTQPFNVVITVQDGYFDAVNTVQDDYMNHLRLHNHLTRVSLKL